MLTLECETDPKQFLPLATILTKKHEMGKTAEVAGMMRYDIGGGQLLVRVERQQRDRDASHRCHALAAQDCIHLVTENSFIIRIF
jgi:hypothetical protein